MTAGPEAHLTDQLALHHLNDLAKSGLSLETALAAGIYSADAAAVATILGFEAGPGLVFPYAATAVVDGTPFQRVKPDTPFADGNGNVAKYLSPKRSRNPAGNRLYLPPGLDPVVLMDPARTLIITEGEKKVIAAFQAGLDVAGFAGVWSWRKRDDDHESQPIDDLRKIDWRGRTVLIIFDSDAVTNRQVQAAERALKQELQRRGALVSIVRLPEPTFEEAQSLGPKFGLDDFLLARSRAELDELINAAVTSLPLGCKTLAALLNEDEKPMPWLVEGIWPVGGCGFFAGEPKSQKSFLSNYLALAVAQGIPFLGRSVCKGSVVMVDEENDRAEVKRRLKQTAVGLGLDPRSKDIYVAAPTLFRLDDDAGIDEMDELLARVKPMLVILDPLVRLHGADENDTSSVSRLLGKVRWLKHRHGCAFIIVHHLRKKNETKTSLGQRMRGSSDLHGWLDAALYFETLPCDQIRVTFESRYAKPPDPMVLMPTLEAHRKDAGYVWAGYFGKPVTPTMLSRARESIQKKIQGFTWKRFRKTFATIVAAGNDDMMVSRLLSHSPGERTAPWRPSTTSARATPCSGGPWTRRSSRTGRSWCRRERSVRRSAPRER
jgi:AAA domain/Domain of unknown function (DUF3854)